MSSLSSATETSSGSQNRRPEKLAWNINERPMTSNQMNELKLHGSNYSGINKFITDAIMENGGSQMLLIF